MTVGIVDAGRSSRADNLRDRIDANPGAGTISFYTAPRPAKGGAVTTLLVALPLADPVAPNAVNGVSTWNVIADVAGVANGDAAWYRTVDGSGNFVQDGSIGVTGSGEDLELDSVTIENGGLVSITSYVATEGNI